MSGHDSEDVLFFFTAFSICTSPVCFVSEVVGQLSPQQVPPVPPSFRREGVLVDPLQNIFAAPQISVELRNMITIQINRALCTL